MDIQAVAFDVDGTFYSNATMYLKSIPFFLSHPVFLIRYYQIRQEIRKIRPIENFTLLQAELLADYMKITRDRARAHIDNFLYNQWEPILKTVPLFPHLKELLSNLRKAGLKLAVVSDLPVERKIKYLGLDGIWDTAFSSEDTGYLKPNPEPFLRICKDLNMKPQQIIYVGNSYSSDILGAKNIGMKAAHIATKKVKDSVADITFKDYKQLGEYLLGTPYPENSSL